MTHQTQPEPDPPDPTATPAPLPPDRRAQLLALAAGDDDNAEIARVDLWTEFRIAYPPTLEQ
ncbi:MAG: hypothetical protein ACKV19_29585 [Verrucomicrobiales bacterium]